MGLKDSQFFELRNLSSCPLWVVILDCSTKWIFCHQWHIGMSMSSPWLCKIRNGFHLWYGPSTSFFKCYTKIFTNTPRDYQTTPDFLQNIPNDANSCSFMWTIHVNGSPPEAFFDFFKRNCYWPYWSQNSLGSEEAFLHLMENRIIHSLWISINMCAY